MLCRLLTTLPSQKQLKWSQLRVGLTVVAASATLMVLIFLMSGTGGWFTRKITIRSYFDNAGGLREGAPVRLAGVDIGNVKGIRIVTGKPMTPVEVTMKVNTKYSFNLRKDSVTLLSTAGILGETYVDVDSKTAKGPEAVDGDILEAHEQPQIEDVVRASQSTLQNIDVLLKRVDRIMAFIESGQGSIGKVIYDPTLYNQLNATVTEFKGLVDDIQKGKGSLGPLFTSDELYKKAVGAVDKLNQIVDDLQQGKGALGKMTHDEEFAKHLQTLMANLSALSDRLEKGEGTAGMLFKDPALYNNSNQMLVETRELIKAIRENPKKYLTFHVKVF